MAHERASARSDGAGHAGAATGAEREPHLDNARGVLIVLVVVGHVIAGAEGALAESLYAWIYMFHMAAFVTVTGVVSRTLHRPDQYVRLLTTLAVPYLIFQTVNAVTRTLAFDAPFELRLAWPGWTLWFLVSLLTWRLLTPLLRALRPAVALGIAVAAAVLVPLDATVDHTLSLGRTVSFLPFFVLGLMLPARGLELLRTRRAAVLGVGGLALLAVVSPVVAERVPRAALYMSGPYADLDAPTWQALVLRVLVLGAGLVGTASVLAVTPRGAGPLTTVGQASLTVYLLHAAVVHPWRGSPLLTPDDALGTLALVPGAAALALLLATPLVVRLTGPAVRPTWLAPLISGRRPSVVNGR